MRYVLALGAIPAVMWAATPSISPPVAKSVTAEGVREQRQDDHTFALRWRPVADMPPTIITEVHYLLVASQEVVGTVPGFAAPQPSPRHRLRANVCARHGMRRVNYGKRWRCRR
jgi:hypothetical protein